MEKIDPDGAIKCLAFIARFFGTHSGNCCCSFTAYDKSKGVSEQGITLSEDCHILTYTKF